MEPRATSYSSRLLFVVSLVVCFGLRFLIVLYCYVFLFNSVAVALVFDFKKSYFLSFLGFYCFGVPFKPFFLVTISPVGSCLIYLLFCFGFPCSLHALPAISPISSVQLQLFAFPQSCSQFLIYNLILFQ